MLGRGMADDGPSVRPTVGTAGTPKSPIWAETRRDVIGRRAIRHAIRRRAIRHATTIPHAVTGDRAIRHAMIISYPRMYAYVCVCTRSFFGCDVVSLLAFSPAVRWCGGPVVRRPGGAAVWWSYDVLLYAARLIFGYFYSTAFPRSDALKRSFTNVSF
jgi:hypothetical protein